MLMALASSDVPPALPCVSSQETCGTLGLWKHVTLHLESQNLSKMAVLLVRLLI